MSIRYPVPQTARPRIGGVPGTWNTPLETAAAGVDLTVADASHSHAADNITLSTGTTLVVQDATHGHAADGPALTTDSTLTVADATHAHAADNITLEALTGTTLMVQDASHAHAADAPALTTDSTLAVDDALHAHAADAPTLSLGNSTLEVQDATHAHLADVVEFDSMAPIRRPGGRSPGYSELRRMRWENEDREPQTTLDMAFLSATLVTLLEVGALHG